eukprot:6176813-Pleurochrysis_carterae.AAC.1
MDKSNISARNGRLCGCPAGLASCAKLTHSETSGKGYFGDRCMRCSEVVGWAGLGKAQGPSVRARAQERGSRGCGEWRSEEVEEGLGAAVAQRYEAKGKNRLRHWKHNR